MAASPSPIAPVTDPAVPRLERLGRAVILAADPSHRLRIAVATMVLVLVIGTIDFILSAEYSMLVFYCLPVVLGTLGWGWRFGVCVALASTGTWIVGDLDLWTHAQWRLPLWWNAGIALGTYLVVIWLVHSFRTLQQELEDRVRERTAALRAEMAERERLEQMLLEISERERRAIGRDLHDGLGQHLTGTAFAGQVLGEKLRARGLAEEAGDADRLVGLVESGIEMSRRLAKGLLLPEIQREGLPDALRDLALDTSRLPGVTCRFSGDEDIAVEAGPTANHLFWIAQEAVRNAVRHGRARHIDVTLIQGDGELELEIRDDGSGLPPSSGRGQGLGLHIMDHRAHIIGATFAIAAGEKGGTVVTCRLPRPSSSPS